MPTIMIFGLGYTGARLAERLSSFDHDFLVLGTRRQEDDQALAFDDEAAVKRAIDLATYVLSSVPPEPDGRDPVLARYGHLLGVVPWLGYLSSTGVYGDTGGAWVDEGAPIGAGRRTARADADAAWQARGARVFRLPGIYGPGRSALERVAAGRTHRVDLPGQVFSRVHVDDIVSGVIAGFDGSPGAYNLADDRPCAQNAVIEEACRLLGREPPPLLPLDAAGLSPQARAFYAENRRVANGKAKRLLGWQPRFRDYRSGLADCYRAFARIATTSPTIVSAPPSAADADQR